tara:strand:- start:74 stop:1573 length:1500 start_codon:yes stop_codon:yes gene_type:complete
MSILQELENKRDLALKGQEIPKTEQQNFKNILRSAVGQGLAFGFGDEVEAFVRSIGTDKKYEDLVKEVRGDLAKFKKEQPALAYGSEIAGSLLTGGLGLGRTALATGARSAGVGGLYGAGMAEGDIGERAKAAAITAPISGVLGGVASKVLPTRTAAAKELMEEGVELTPGQALGGIVGSGLRKVEEAATAIPGLGTGEALERSTQSFNRAVLNRTLKKVDDELPKDLKIEDAPKYFTDSILNKLNTSVRSLEIKNVNDIRKNINDALLNSPLTKSEINRINTQLNKMIFDKAKKGKLTGKDLQAADSFLNRQTRNFSKSLDAAQREIGDVYSSIYNNFSDYLVKNNPKNLVKSYKDAKGAYGDLLIISKAGTRGAGDTVFTPRQLLAQSRAYDPTSAKRRTFIGQGRLQDIGRLGEDVLGRTVPDSGTFTRTLTGAGLLGGLGYGVIDPATALGSTLFLGAYQTPQTQQALLRSLMAGSQALQRTAPYISGRLSPTPE